MEVYDELDPVIERKLSRLEALAAVVPMHKALSSRAERRRLKRRRIRGIRPTDPITLRTSHWFREFRKDLGPVAGDPRKALLSRAHQHDIELELEPSPVTADTEISATTEIVEEAEDCDVTLEGDSSPVAVVVMPVEEVLISEPEDEADGLDSELVSLLSGEIADDVLELPVGFHLLDGDGDYAGGYFSRRLHLERLQEAAETEPDWGDPELWERFRHEPAQLIVRM